MPFAPWATHGHLDLAAHHDGIVRAIVVRLAAVENVRNSTDDAEVARVVLACIRRTPVSVQVSIWIGGERRTRASIPGVRVLDVDLA